MESQPVENRNGFSKDEKKERASSGSNELRREKKIFFETKSLAEVYANQGHISMALEIYKRIQKRNPSDQQVEKRISELESHLSTRRAVKSKEQGE